MKFTKVNDTVLSDKVLLRVESSEGDGDNSRWEEALLGSMLEAETLVNILKKHKKFGNGEWNPDCSEKERDIIGDWVGFDCYGDYVRVLDAIELVTYDVIGDQIVKTTKRVDLNG